MKADRFCFWCLGVLALVSIHQKEYTASAIYIGTAFMWMALCVLNMQLKRLIELQEQSKESDQ